MLPSARAHRRAEETGRCFSTWFLAATTPAEPFRRPPDRLGVVCARRQMHHSAAGSKSA